MFRPLLHPLYHLLSNTPEKNNTYPGQKRIMLHISTEGCIVMYSPLLAWPVLCHVFLHQYSFPKQKEGKGSVQS